ncbi:cupin [Arthrobacter sp.]|uniref:cupin n=1 Tax=Arthrobacter sp. TaxID=1667 RepID=UPI003A926EC2
MSKAELDELVQEHLERAKTAPHRRSATAVLKDGRLRQTLMALDGGSELADHTKPEAATLLVLHGSVTVRWADGEQVVGHGGLYVIPDVVHNVVAAEPAVFLLTTIAG